MHAPSLPFRIRKLRLATGLILFFFVLTHFLNHAAGLISLQAAEDTRHWFLWFWRQPVPSTVLYSALTIHLLLALWAVYQRRRLMRMPPAEALQLALGLAIVPLLAQHVLGTRAASAVFGVTDSYTYVLLALWHLSPMDGVRQAVALVVAWIHGCIGLWFWLRLKPWYRQWQPILHAGALLVPVLALIGFFVAGRQVSELANDPMWLRAAIAGINPPNADARAQMATVENSILLVFAAALGGTLLARMVRTLIDRRRGVIRLTYPGGREIKITPGMTVLEASQLASIPHASVCGGRGRCSTCRIRISRGLETLPRPSPQESTVLQRIGAAPGVRLACQMRPTADLTVTPLLPPGAGPRSAFARPMHLEGQEQDIAVLFADLRGFTSISEGKLPYDVVFVLNRYFAAMGQAIERAGGRLDKFIGDGVMALFGIESGPAMGARQALAAARAMAEELNHLNQMLAHELERPLRIGIGIHVGPAIVGEMGYARATSLTAIGDTVNTASRLEGLTKELGAELVVSDDVAGLAGIDLSGFPQTLVEIRGRRMKLCVRAIERATSVPDPAAPAPSPSV